MEIETRAKLDNKEEIIKKLKELGWTGDNETEQKDAYFVHKTRKNELRGPGHQILRIRQSPEGNFLTFKALTEEKGVWTEHETEISDPEEIRQILLKTGFVADFVIEKKRIKGKIKDMEVCVDDFPKIGPYIECEIISDNQDSAFQRLSAFLKSLGIPEKNFEHRGYGRIFAEMAGIKFKD